MPQTSIPSKPPIGFEGQIAAGIDTEVHANINATGAPLPFGRFVTIDAAKVAECESIPVKLPSSAEDIIEGITLYEPAIQADANGLREYADKRAVSVLKRGQVMMIPEQDVGPTDQPFCRITQGDLANQTPGRVRKDADTSEGSPGAARAIPVLAQFMGAALAGQPVAVRLIVSGLAGPQS